MTATMTLSTEDFTWDGTHGTAMASDIGIRVGERPEFLVVESAKVEGYALRFWFWNQEVREGDLLSTTYVTTKDGKHVVITVWND
jgi:hypothetical protein